MLGSNLNAPVGKTAITSSPTTSRSTSTVTGYPAMKSAWYGIVGASGADSATIKNGTITEFKFDGINGEQANIGSWRTCGVENGGNDIGVGA